MTEPSTLWCAVLGPLLVQVGPAPLSLPGKRQQALLAALALQPRVHLPARALSARVWPDESDPPDAALHVLVHRVRRRLAAADPGAARLLRHSARGYLLDLPPGGSDLDTFRDHARRARTAGVDHPALAAEHARRAVELVRGEPGQELWPDPQRWPEVRAVGEEITEVRRIGLQARLRTGDHLAVLSELTALAQREPLTEWIHDLLLRALYLAGRQHEAVTAYARFRAAVAAELGLSPGPGISATYRMVLGHHPALLPAGPPTAHPGRAPGPGVGPRATVTDSPLRDSMRALDRAGDFAAAQGGYDQAVDCYRSLLGLQAEPAERARILLRLGEARYHASGTGHEELAGAAAIFHRDGDLSRAAEALSWRARARWLIPDDADPVGPQLARILDLVDPRRPGPAGTAALVNACGLLAVTGQPRAARRAGLLGLAWARRLALTPLDLRARSNLAMIAVDDGDLGAVDELAAVLAAYRSRGVWVPPALLVTLADAEERAGLLSAARAHRSAAMRVTRSRGATADLAWLEAEQIRESFHRGRWQEATDSARAFLAGPQQEHRMAGEVHLVVGRIAATRGDLSSALRHADAAVRLARRGGGRSTLGPALTLRLHLAVLTGQPAARVRALRDEVLGTIEGRSLTASFGAQLPLALAAAGLRTADLAGHRPADSAWRDALDAVLAGEPDRARERYERLGSSGDARQVAGAFPA
ncbi:AfsR/SARP family transcriptional regulator [Micromonospora coxensis]|uniref:DNA-binding transcriptional activator of the SARP family n=1 Tax=Micromonospora coxensis TaxID=356852 RepID=A0A1C5K288_9ACTN|nr:AfsR/SARP family transcriptional regulator [Micromonospora coxensis]SCG76406.1 DNA-binding transcriptional activator of the SARP family [Micromonospora coxensis]